MLGAKSFGLNLLKYIIVSQVIFLLTCSTYGQTNESSFQPHPRLFLNEERLLKIKNSVHSEPYMKFIYQKLNQDVRGIQTGTTSFGNSQKPGAVLPSREFQRRILLFSIMYRLTNKLQFAERARDEMIAASRLKDWNPEQFLTTAEMTFGMAVGYDWLHDFLDHNEKQIIKDALLTKGLSPGLDDYRNNGWWTNADHNWNIVCNSSLVVGALSIGDEEPNTYSEIIENANHSIEKGLKTFAPDGGWKEGPMYWRYASRYLAYYFDALSTAQGIEPISIQLIGLSETGMFRIFSIGPSGKSFNFSDSNDRIGAAPQMFWFAHKYNIGAYSESEKYLSLQNVDVFHLIWSILDSPSSEPLPLAKAFRGIDSVALRSGWNKNDFYVGLKGSEQTLFPHAHLDAGNFILDAYGQRWFSDLDSASYYLPEVFGKLRWTYYRNGVGHNTLLINGEGPYLEAQAKIRKFNDTPDNLWASLDLTEPYRKRVRSYHRGVFLTDSKVLLIDDIVASNSVNIEWRGHTTADVLVDQNQITLDQKNETLKIMILSPSIVSIKVTEPQLEQAEDPETENGIKYKLISILFTTSEPRTKLALSFSK